MFYFLLFFLAQSQIVQTQSINSRSRSRSRILAVCFKLFTFDSGFFSFSAKKINHFFTSAAKHTTLFYPIYTNVVSGEKTELSFIIYPAVYERYVNDSFVSIVFCLVLFALIRPIIIAVTIVYFNTRFVVLFLLTDTLAVLIFF